MMSNINQLAWRVAFRVVVLSGAVTVAAVVTSGCGSGASAELSPVSGEKLGSMGEPYVVEHEGKQIKLCCEGCKDDFAKAAK